MKTVTTNRICSAGRRVPVSPWLLGLGLTFLISASALQAQLNVVTLGGGPHTLGGSSSGSANGNTFLTAQFNNPLGGALDSSGNLYIADSSNGSIRKITNPGNRTTSVTSNLVSGLLTPVAITVDPGNNLYVLTQGDGSIRKYNSSGTLLATITAALTSPTALVMDSSTNFFVTELGGAVKQITAAGVVTTRITAISGTFSSPRGIAFFDTNNLAISDTGNNAIKLLKLVNNTVLTFAGGNGAGFADGDADTAKFNTPWQLTSAPNGSLIIADRLNHRVRALTPEGTVATIYGVGVDSNNWFNVSFPDYPGWLDGTNALANLPSSVLVGPAGTNIIVMEHGYHLIRQAGGFSFSAAVGGAPAGGGITNGTTVSQNVISFGFANGEGSSQFVGAPGQVFFAPITLTLPATQPVFSLGFSVAVTNDTGSLPVVAGAFGFGSMLVKPTADGYYAPILPQFLIKKVTNVVVQPDFSLVTNIDLVFTNAVFTNASKNLLSVSWLETPGQTNLYNTTTQDLIQYSQAHIHLFNARQSGKAILGAYGFQIPALAAVGDTYRIRVFNASGTSNITDKVVFTAPTNGLVSSLKTVTVATNSYLVGDINPFRWLNAGDFGDNTLDSSDAQETFMAAIYHLNLPPLGSDFFDAMDSSDGSVNSATGNIDLVTLGDGKIDVDDVLVTLRRSLDPSSKWIVRFRSPAGVLTARDGTNTLEQPFNAARLSRPLVAIPQASAIPTAVTFSAGDAVVGANRTITVPIRATIAGDLFAGGFKLSRLMLGVTVKPLDGSPALTSQIQFAQVANLGTKSFTTTRGVNNYSTAWLNNFDSPYIGLSSGTQIIGNLTITVPANAGPQAAYSVHFDHVSASPSSILETHIVDGLVTLSDRSRSTLGDAIPDSWRLKYFGTAYSLASGADVDADGDGVSNWAEFKAGTNPNDQNSRLHMQTGSASDMVVRWPTVVGKNYVIEASTSLFGSSWKPVSATIPGTGQLMEFRPTPDGSAQFYRVRLVE